MDGNGRQTPWSYQTADGEWHYTKGQKPQPWFADTLDAERDNLVKMIGEFYKEQWNNL